MYSLNKHLKESHKRFYCDVCLKEGKKSENGQKSLKLKNYLKKWSAPVLSVFLGVLFRPIPRLETTWDVLGLADLDPPKRVETSSFDLERGSPTKLVRLMRPILQLFSSGSSPGPGTRASFVTKKHNFHLKKPWWLSRLTC